MSLQPTVRPWQEPLHKLPTEIVKNSTIASGHHLTTLTQPNLAFQNYITQTCWSNYSEDTHLTPLLNKIGMINSHLKGVSLLDPVSFIMHI